MNRRDIMRGAATAALALGMATPSMAQEPATAPAKKHERVKVQIKHELSPTMAKMTAELGAAAADYWTTRLNSYKSRIDRILSPDDLEKLNRMRVRFGVMLAEHSDVSMSKTALRDRETVTENEEIVVHRNRTDDDGVAEDGSERRMRTEVKVRIQGDSQNALEIFGLHQSAKQMAEAYRADLDALGRDVIADFVTFLKEMKESGAKFMEGNKVAIEREADGKKVALALQEADDVIASFDTEEKRAMMQMVYSLAIEPIVLLYDGADLNQIFSQAGPLSSAVTGLNLPETSALKQSVPNPASSSATIGYELTEPSSSTLLRLYNASGELVGTYDQGAREAGEHAATVDLSKLPNGVYLYHLRVQTQSGERVYSKALQVAR